MRTPYPQSSCARRNGTQLASLTIRAKRDAIKTPASTSRGGIAIKTPASTSRGGIAIKTPGFNQTGVSEAEAHGDQKKALFERRLFSFAGKKERVRPFYWRESSIFAGHRSLSRFGYRLDLLVLLDQAKRTLGIPTILNHLLLPKTTIRVRTKATVLLTLLLTLTTYAQPTQQATALLAGGTVVNTTTTNEQQHPTLAVAADGSYVVAWQSQNEVGGSSRFDVYAQRYTTAGTANGSAFKVNGTTNDDQRRPAAAMMADGRFAIAWMDVSTGTWRVALQRYNADGTPDGSQTILASGSDHFKFPTLTATSTGTWVAAWQRIAADGGTFSIEVARISATDGSTLGTHTPATGSTWLGHPAVAGASGDDRFVVAWQGRDGDGSAGVFAQRYGTDGAASGSTFTVPSTTTNNQIEPAVAMDGATGDFAVTWSSGSDIYARRYAADGTAAGDAFTVNTTTANAQHHPRAAYASASGNQGRRLTIGWDSYGQDGSLTGVYYQQYDLLGQSFGGETRAATTTDGFQQHVALAQPNVGLNLAVVWQSGRRHENIGNDGYDIYQYLPTADPTVYVNATAGTGNDHGWRMLAAPCAGRGRSDLSFANSITGNDEVQLYDESAGGPGNRWLTVASGTSLPQGQGFIAYLFDDAALTLAPGFGIGFSGCTETTGDFDRTGLDVNEQFYLAGNPYYTSFDLSDGLDLVAAGHQATVQVWDPTASGGTGSYQLLVSGTANDKLAMGQGFMVQRTTVGAGAATLPFKAAGRTTGGTFLGKGEAASSDVAQLDLRLEGTNDAGVQVHDEAATILFLTQATHGWDAYEATKYTPLTATYATVAVQGERNGESVALALASYPLALQQPLALPLQIDGRGYDGPLTLSWPTLDLLPEAWVLELEDPETGSRINLRETTELTFSFTSPSGKGEGATTTASVPTSMAAQPGSERFVLHIDPTVNTSTEAETPHTFALEAAYPNPFNPQTTLAYSLAAPVYVRLAVYDALGREVRVLQDGPQPAGQHRMVFDARDLSSGLYLYRLETPAFQATRSMLLLK